MPPAPDRPDGDQGPPEKRRAEDNVFGQILMERGVLAKADLDRALREQHEAAQRGAPRRLGQILVARGMATIEQVESALDHQRKRIVICEHCIAQFNVPPDTPPEEEFSCPRCGRRLRIPDRLYT
ncbi:MAG: hypothetical protein HY722_12340, partial [Planctomycetes bacterium]|nr:hypothetical protein [Planctomycetota bacterium]